MTAVAETNEPGGDAVARSARPRHLIVTVYGLYARSDGGWLSVAALIRLLAELGVDEPAVRSAISRLKRRGILEARRQEGSAGYRLSAEALAILREGDARIFRRRRASLADGWLRFGSGVGRHRRWHPGTGCSPPRPTVHCKALRPARRGSSQRSFSKR